MIQTWRKTSSELIYSPNVIKDIHMKTIDGYDVKIFTDNIEDAALDQIRQLLSIDVFSDCKIRIMPDVHAGAGCVIGFTGNLGDKVIPNIVGVDIGCGMLVQPFSCNSSIDFHALNEYILHAIPSGRDFRDEQYLPLPQKYSDLYHNAKQLILQLRCYRELKEVRRLYKSIGSLGGGKSFCNNLLVYYSVLFGGQAVILDPKSERGNWKETLPEIAEEINIVNLTSDKENAGLLDPFVIMKDKEDGATLAKEILTFLTGISTRDGDKFPVLISAISKVSESEQRGLLNVITELRKENTPIANHIANHIDSFTNYDFAHLLFSDGTAKNTISLDNQLNIIQVADLVLPDKDTTFDEYTTIELLSVAMLIVISTFALDFIHSDRSIFKIVDLDEAWAFLNVAQGETLSNKLVRAGRAMNAGVYFVTQSSGDVSKESLKNNIGLKFAFRSTDTNEIKQTLEFFGLDSEDENNQKRLRDLENGQCLMQDLYGRVGVVQIHPVFVELLHAFDTRPPIKSEVDLE